MKGRILPRSELSGLSPTVHGGHGWEMEGIEDYSHNLNPFGPPDVLQDIVCSAIKDVGHYPDDSCRELKETISKTFEVKPECITIGAGSSDIIRNVPNTFLERGSKALVACPSFAEYTQQCRIAGAEVKKLLLRPEEDFRIDPEEFMEAASDCSCVFICNPNNPTGRIESRDKLVNIIRACEDQGTLVFLDETLLELIPGYADNTFSGMVDRFSNLVVASSLTKSFAIPGIRIGYALANPDIISEMEKVRMTWNVGQIEQTVANVLIRDHMDYIDQAAEIMAVESENMNQCLNEIGFPEGDVSDSFFYFRDISPLGMDAPEFKKRMLAQGIMVRDCSSFGPDFTSYIRYSVKDHERNCRFIKAADSVINGRSDASPDRCRRHNRSSNTHRPFHR